MPTLQPPPQPSENDDSASIIQDRKTAKTVRFNLPPLPKTEFQASSDQTTTSSSSSSSSSSLSSSFLPVNHPLYHQEKETPYEPDWQQRQQQQQEEENTRNSAGVVSPTPPSFPIQLFPVRPFPPPSNNNGEVADMPFPDEQFAGTNTGAEVSQDYSQEYCSNDNTALPDSKPHPTSSSSSSDAISTGCDTTQVGLQSPQPQKHQHQHQQTHKRRKFDESAQQEKARLKDIIGHGVVKLRIDEIILPLGLPAAVADSVLTGIRAVPASILLYGPPGCGKTHLARAVAGEAAAAFFSVAPSDILSKFVGESESAVRNVFRKAVVHALQLESRCAVVFFDEIDALGQSRETKGAGEGEGCSRRVLAELLLQLNVIADRKYCTLRDFAVDSGEIAHSDDDACDDDEISLGSLQQHSDAPASTSGARIIVVAATNRIDDCDSALLRRFGIQLEVKLPTRRDRKKMLFRHLASVDHSLTQDDLGFLAAVTEEWSGSAIERLAREAAMAPVRDGIRRAALTRRKTAKLEQSGGAASDEEASKAPDPDMEARNTLLESFQNLRPVSMEDFRDAIRLLTGAVLPISTAIDEREFKPKHHTEHYDSSSDED